MEGLTTHAPMTRLLRERSVFERNPFVLLDIGCAGGIDAAWREFGPSLVARGYDPDVEACEEAQAGEPFDNVRYHARYVGLPESHPFVQRRKADEARWPATNIWGRITAGYLAQRERVHAAPARPRRMAEPDTLIGVDEIVRVEKLPTVDFLKVDVDGPDLEVLESARHVLANSRVLGVGMEVNWFGTANPTEHTFHNTDLFMREQGFALFGLTFRRYSRTDMPAPFEYEMYAQTRFGQPYQGDAIYLRDLAADYHAVEAADYPPDKLIKLACIYELAGLPDCAAEVLNRFDLAPAEFGEREPLLDALTPPLLGEQLSYRRYVARFERATKLFLPSAAAAAAPTPSATADPRAGAPISNASPEPGLAQRLEGRVRRRVRSLGSWRVRPAAVAARARSDFLQNAPTVLVHSVAARLGRARPLALDPAWRFHVPADGEGPLTLLKRDIWAHYRDRGIDTPIAFRWYDGLRVHLYLGNDLSLCLYVLGAFEPNEFVFLKRVLEPGMVVLDGGANEGLFTMYAARRVAPEGAVLAVEPSTREFERLEANISLNRLENVRTFKAALGSRGGEAVLAVAYKRHAGMNAIEVRAPGERLPAWTTSKEAVSVERIDELVARSGVQRLDLVKLDIEGSEVDAIHGASTTISEFRPLLLLEAEETRLRSQGRTKDDLVSALEGFGYELWVFDTASAQLRPAELPREPEGNAIAAPQGWRPPLLGE
jgi:FkbM family methyltransferase